MTTLTIALLQMTQGDTDLEANKVKGEMFCRQAQQMGADIALFPEMWSICYSSYEGWAEAPEAEYDIWRAPALWTPEAAAYRFPAGAVERWQARAIGRDDAFILHFRELAQELEMAIAITYLETWVGAPRNTVSLIDRHGEIVLTYAKVHTCVFSAECALTPGDDFYVCTLNTAQGLVKIGAMICFDREFPESARILMLKGAEIILVPNASDLEVNRLGLLRARAFENAVGVALANYAAPEEGHSVAYDPIAFGVRGSRDTLIVEAGTREGIYLAPFDLDALRAWRLAQTQANAFRRPQHYGPLIARDIAAPFIRVNAQGEPYDQVR